VTPRDPIHQRGNLLPYDCVETVGAGLRKHAGSTAPPRTPQQHPKCVIILNAKGINSPLCIFDPQGTRVEGLTKSFKQRYLNLSRATSKPAGQHIAPDCQCPSFAFNILVIAHGICEDMTQIPDPLHNTILLLFFIIIIQKQYRLCLNALKLNLLKLYIKICLNYTINNYNLYISFS
jgi:hypothetical protein